MKKLFDYMQTYFVWISLFYPVYIGTNLLLDHFVGTQAFHASLIYGAQRLLIKQIFSGWLFSLWIPLLFAFLMTVKLPSNLSIRPFSRLLVISMVVVILFKVYFGHPAVAMVPFGVAFIAVGSIHLQLLGGAR